MKLIAVSDDRYSVAELASAIREMQDYVDFVHIREKSKSAGELAVLLQLLKQGGVIAEKIVLNDRLDLALLFGIPNVQLPGHGLPVALVKEMYPHLNVGRSVHSVSEAKQAENDGADFVLYGHCFETSCKPGKPANGLALLAEIVRELKVPVYGVGGITPNRVGLVQEAGASGVAIMSGIFSANQPAHAAQNFYRRLTGSKTPTSILCEINEE